MIHADALGSLNFRDLLKPEGEATGDAAFLTPLQNRASARLIGLTPMSPAERLEAFKKVRFYPHGLFLPDDLTMRTRIRDAVRRIGDVPDDQLDQRLTDYRKLQDKTAELEARGIPGHWTGQQGVARSPARFRLVVWGRRGGKTAEAAAEALSFALTRPRSWIWITAPTMTGVSRSFDMVIQMIADLKIGTTTKRDSEQTKLVVLENESRIEGVSLDDPTTIAGAKIDLAIVDEAANVAQNAWERAILPPLADRKGRALLISSPEGDDNFFAQLASTAKQRKVEFNGVPLWDVFQDPSWEVNFYMFPQGKQSQTLLELQMSMTPKNFQEQFGGEFMGSRDRVFPEFMETVHTGYYPFNPDHPVRLAVDPSGGANPYAIAAIQDYGEYFIVIDEFYERSMTTEEIAPILDKRPWRGNVTEVVVDSAQPQETLRWCDAGYPAFPVFNKPKIDERLPLQRNHLRDPARFYILYREKVNAVLGQRGLPANADLGMEYEENAMILAEVEEMLTPGRLTADDLQRLRMCSRMYIDRRCVNTIHEHRVYKYVRKRDERMNLREVPQDANNHTIDLLGYYIWQFRRSAEYEPLNDSALVGVTARMPDLTTPLEGPGGAEPVVPLLPRGPLADWRRMFNSAPGYGSGSYSVLRPY